jgi:hypothetical protein
LDNIAAREETNWDWMFRNCMAPRLLETKALLRYVAGWRMEVTVKSCSNSIVACTAKTNLRVEPDLEDKSYLGPMNSTKTFFYHLRSKQVVVF